jgi:hypothetical protein
MDSFLKMRGWTLVNLEITMVESDLHLVEKKLGQYDIRVSELTLTAVRGRQGEARIKIKDVEQEAARRFMMEARKIPGVRRIEQK